MTNIGTLTITDARGIVLSPAAQGALNLAATGLREILQNVRVICNTRKGTVMGDRQFGLDYSFLDVPQNKAQLMIVATVCAGLAHFEPRVTFHHMQFDINLTTLAMDWLLSIHINASELKVPSR